MIRNSANARHRRDADNAFKAVGQDRPMTDYEKEQQSFRENRERLRTERLEREARAKDSPK